MQKPWTHIVVGAGTAGCLIAARLADASESHRVLLVEGGGSDRGVPRFQIPVGYLSCIGNPASDWMYSTQPCHGLNGRALKYPRGKGLGGCSSINGMLYMRGQRRDYDGWAAALGEPSWTWDAMLPMFKKHERHWSRDVGSDDANSFHGFDGELHVEKQRLHWPVLDDLRDCASEQLQLPVVDDFNRGDNEGVGYFEVTQRNGRRWSSASAFLFSHPGEGSFRSFTQQSFFLRRLPRLPTMAEILLEGALHYSQHQKPVGLHPAPGRKNLTIALGYTVARVHLEGSSNVCAGVEAIPASQPHQLITFPLDTSIPNAEVILSAGAIATPAILMRSGVGPQAQLERIGVKAKCVNEGVGANLQDHLQIRTVYRLDAPAAKGSTLNSQSRNPAAVIKMARDFSLRGVGPLTMAPSQLGCFAKSNPNEKHANVEFHIQPLSLDAFGQPLHAFDGVTISVCNLNPKSHGTVTLQSSDPLAAPIISPNYLDHEDDRRVAVEAINLAREVGRAPRFVNKYQAVEIKPGVTVRSAEDLIKAAGDISTTIFHPSCTCKMGVDSDPMAVLTPKLQLRGTERLRVCDASAMPWITSGNTNEPVLAMAERLATWIAEGEKRS